MRVSSILLLIAAACSNSSKPADDSTLPPLDSDTDSDTDADTDSDTDTDTDSDTDTDTDTDTALYSDAAADTDTDTDTDPNDTGIIGFSVVINEVLADPGLYDGNCDGIVDPGDDEFIEVVNNGSVPVNLTGATLADGVQDRHVFGPLVLQPNEAVVVFGGGSPTFDGSSPTSEPWCVSLPGTVTVEVSSTGDLGLNNSGDTVTLTGAQGAVLDVFTFGGEGGDDQSVVHVPELDGTSPIEKHGDAPGSIGVMSPGTLVTGGDFDELVTTTPTGDTNTTPTASTGDTGNPTLAGQLVINEILADPGTVVDGDCDGTVSSTLDEFVELHNAGPTPVNLSGGTLSDALQVRVTFPAGTVVPPGGTLLVFGGGTPTFDGTGSAPWCGALPAGVQVLSLGSLGLNNSGDSVIVADSLGTVIDQYDFGSEGGNDQSITRDPELSLSPMVEHSTVSSWLASPGVRADGGLLGIPQYSTGDTAPTGATGGTGDTGAGIDTGDPRFELTINEILADPDAGTGDANCDGVVDTSDDEFVEIVNTGSVPVDLTDVTLHDAVSQKHTFGPSVLAPGDVVVVFGGGTPTFDGSQPGGWCQPLPPNATVETATTGSLALTNTGDTVTLYGPLGGELTSYSYGGEGGQNESLNRVPELSDQAMVLHTSVPGATEAFSPGRFADGSPIELPTDTAATGETGDTGLTGDTGGNPDLAALDPGDLVITEFMQNPSIAGDNDGEWFEVYNASGTTLDLRGLEVSDLGSDSTTVDVSVVVAPGQYVVFGVNADGAVNGGLSVDVELSSFSLGNTDDEIVLAYRGTTFDTVVYDDGATFPDGTGASASLDPSARNATANDDGSNWCLATTPYGDGDLGTPGAANDSCGVGPTGQTGQTGDTSDTGLTGDTNDTGLNPDLLGLVAGDLVISEFIQDPAAVGDTSGEWFEVYNNSGTALNLDGLVLSDLGSNSHTVSGTVTVAAGDYVVFGTNADVLTNGGVSVDYEYSSFSLGNTDDEIILSYEGTTFDTVAYDDGATFPDGTGASAQLDPTALDATANDDGSNWCLATTPYGDGDLGTPGAANDSCATGPTGDTGPTGSTGPTGPTGDTTDTGDTGLNPDLLGLVAGDLVISEFIQDPAAVGDTSGEWFEVYNNSGTALNLDGLVLSDLGSNSHTVSGTVTVAAGDYVVFGTNADVLTNGGVSVDYEYSSFSLGNTDDEIILSYEGTTFDTVAYDDGATFPDGTGASAQLDPTALDATANDDGSNWCLATSPYGDGDLGTPGAANDSCAVDTGATADTGGLIGPLLVINEVLADPDVVTGDANCDGTVGSGDDEFVEIVNIGDQAIDLDGAVLSDLAADRLTFGTLVLDPGDAVVVFGGGTPTFDGTSPNPAAWCVTLPSSVTVLQAPSGLVLNNGGDTVTLRDSLDVTLATVTYGTEGGNDTSLVLQPELDEAGTYTEHGTVAVEAWSPGTRADGSAL